MSSGHPALLALVLSAQVLLGCDGGGEERASTPLPQPDPPSAPDEHELPFEDVTSGSGLSFEHATGAYGRKLLPETMGSGLALLDREGDGILDVFFVNAGVWPGRASSDRAKPRCAFYRGLGELRFEDVTDAVGAGLELFGMGATAADFDGDGDTDVYVTALADNALLRNDGTGFTEVAAEAGVRGGRWRDRSGSEHPEWSTSAAWLDADRDGHLDLFVGNYCRWTPEIEVFTTLDGIDKAFTTPELYEGLPCRLYKNRGDGTFTEEGLSLGPHEAKSLGVAVWDFRDDGFPDVAVANDTRPNSLFFNYGDGRFEDVGARWGMAYDQHGRARAGMGIDVAEYANDGVPAIAIGNFAGEGASLFRLADRSSFRQAAGPARLDAATRSVVTFGLLFADMDLDGWQDLVLANGHIEPDIALYEPDRIHAQPGMALLGAPDGRFREVGPDGLGAFAAPRVARGMATGDLDGDGDLDLIVSTNGGRAALFRNLARERGTGHFLRVRLRGRAPNVDALGAKVSLRMRDRTEQTRIVRTGSSYGSQSELTLTFGLGAAAEATELHVRWPSGAEHVHPVEGVDATIELTEP